MRAMPRGVSTVYKLQFEKLSQCTSTAISTLSSLILYQSFCRLLPVYQYLFWCLFFFYCRYGHHGIFIVRLAYPCQFAFKCNSTQILRNHVCLLLSVPFTSFSSLYYVLIWYSAWFRPVYSLLTCVYYDWSISRMSVLFSLTYFGSSF